MKTKLIWILCLLAGPLTAQQFTKVTSGPVVSTPGDSRSVNFIDFNGDGYDDLFISNGLGAGQADEVYLNQGDGTFVAAPAMDLNTDVLPSVGATFADWDNDGDLDGYVTNWYGEANHFYQNDGSGMLNSYAVPDNDSWGSHAETATWADYDQDGKLDLFVTNSGGDRKNRLFRSEGSTFVHLQLAGVSEETDYSRNANWVDVNADGYLDLFVTNENNQHNDLYLNQPNAALESVDTGTIVDDQFSSMGSSWGDIDNDGDLDLFVANAGFYQEQPNRLYRNDGDGVFTLLELEMPSMDEGCSFGSAFVDYDNDADLDLMVANGFCGGNLANFMYENVGGSFQRRYDLFPDTVEICSYGLAWSDVNQDGFLDLAIANCKNVQASPQPTNDFYLNNGNENHWLQIDLEGTLSNRSAVGSIVRVKATINGVPVWQMRDLNTQSGYCGQNSMTLHFGLGDAVEVDTILVEWPRGGRKVWTGVAADQRIQIQEDLINETHPVPSPFQSLLLYPNPADKQLQLKWSWVPGRQPVGALQLRILTLSGQAVYTHPPIEVIAPDSMQLQVPTAQFQSGTYFIELHTGAATVHRKFIRP
ncbi:MAG: VCBS repeat-containing protein [Phaeodactylibacter sp.]|nr:VCBS repeat-containing protein [Phaeodactylibacter sp.]